MNSSTRIRETILLHAVQDWELQADLWKLFPSTSDQILYSHILFYIVELMVPWEDPVEDASSTQTLQRGQEKGLENACLSNWNRLQKGHSYVCPPATQQANETNQSVEIIYSRLGGRVTETFAVDSTGDVVAISLKQRKEGPHLMTPLMMLITL